MLSTLALSVCLAGWLAEDLSKTPDPNYAAYEAAKAKAGRNADEHVKLALWCEQHGLNAERTKHLAIAVLNNPNHAVARGLLGMVEYAGKWRRPEAVNDTVKADQAFNQALAEYNGKRAKALDTVESQWKLGIWCEQKGLKAEALAHFAAVTRLDPNHEGAWKRLGYRKAGGRWVQDGQLTREKAEFDAQKKADKSWFKQLTKWRAALNDPKKQAEAEKGLDGVTDPRAVPAIWIVFGHGTAGDQKRATTMLGQIATAESSQALAMLSVFSESAEVRRHSAEILKGRDPRDYIGWMVDLLRDELKFEVKPVDGPGSPGILFVEGERFNLRRFYSPPALPNIPLFAGEPITYDADGLPVVTRLIGMGNRVESHSESTSYTASYNQIVGNAPIRGAAATVLDEARAEGNIQVNAGYIPKNAMTGTITQTTTTTTVTPEQTTVQIPVGRIMLEYQNAANASEADLEADLKTVKRENKAIKERNDRVALVLRNVTGHDGGTDRETWKAWTTDKQGYAYKPTPKAPKPTVDENVPSSYVIPNISMNAATVPVSPGETIVSRTASAGSPHACFKAGTKVKTLKADQTIETIEVGDEVLTQNTTTGVLSYQPILAVFHNPPTLTYRVDLGSETISSTGIHRFWKTGQGWVMARDLKPGDKVRTLNGPAEVKAVTEETVVPVFNLEVAAGQSFFVGDSGTLVHDNSLVLPVYRPFDQPQGEPAAVASAGN